MHSNNGPTIIPFIVGSKDIIEDLDPQWAWFLDAWDVIDQVCEGLFKYDLSHPSHEIVPNLASADGTWFSGGLEFLVPLRQGITFHDGYKFNASAVKWSFDRLAFLMNVTGELPDTTYYGMPTILHSLYEWPTSHAGWYGTPIINRTEVFSEYVVKFVLNKPYSAFKALLCFPGSYILSPLSTPATDYINPTTGDVVGTGPFLFDTILPNIEVNLSAYENYWRGKAHIDRIIFKHIYNNDARHNALLNGTIHFIEDVWYSYIDDFKAANNLTVLDSGALGATSKYLGMNNKQINKTWRQAISYAINYSEIKEKGMHGQASRLKSPLPEGILYANSSFDYPVFDVKKAREIMQSMGFGVAWDSTFPGADEVQWTSANFRTLNYTYNWGNFYREHLFDILEDNLAYIGILVEDAGLAWEPFKDRFYNFRLASAGYDALQLFDTGWMPDFNDPSNYINTIFSNTSTYNQGQIIDPYLQILIEQGVEEYDPLVREAIYDEIQQYLVEDSMPYAWLHVNNLCTAHHINLTGFQQNGFNILDFYSCEWNPYNFKIQINSPTDINFVKGSSGNNITWTMSAEHFSNPTYNLTVNGILNRTDSWQSDVPIIIYLDHLSPGIYTYQITAQNGDETVQDVVIVNVDAHELTINHPGDITFIEGSTGMTITWIIMTNLEINPIYDLYINDSLSNSDSWNSGIPVVVNLDNLTVGSYEYHIEASNGVELIEDTVIVNVNAKTQEDGTITLIIIIGGSIGAAIVVVLTIVLIRKRRK